MTLDEFLAYLADEPDWLGIARVDVMTRGVSGDTPLHAALWAADDQAARSLVDAGADVNASGEEGYTPLHVAVAQKNAPMAKYLASRGASWETVSELGSSPREKALASDDLGIRELAKGTPD